MEMFDKQAKLLIKQELKNILDNVEYIHEDVITMEMFDKQAKLLIKQELKNILDKINKMED